MKIHYEATTDVTKYIDNHGSVALEERSPQFENFMRALSRYTEITPQTKILEIGTGAAWFPDFLHPRRPFLQRIRNQLVTY